MEEKRLFLLDAYALIFRAYYALIKVPRITSSGFNTSAVFGFVNTLEELLSKQRPTHLAVCFDPPGPTFRNEASEAYKAERSETPEDIKKSIPFIKRIVEAYRIPILEVPGFEADDVVGTMARRAEKQGYTVYMMSPDKDFGQLVSDSVLQYKPSYRGQDFELRGVAEVCQRFQIQRPAQVIDYLALAGDSIDNIPGCPGVGEKTAVKLLHDYGDVDGILANVDSLKGALKRKIEDNAEQIRFSRFLATIRTDVPVEQSPDDLILRHADTRALYAIFDELEFRSLRQRVEKRLQASARQASTPSLFDDFDDLAGPEPQQPAQSLFDSEIDLHMVLDPHGVTAMQDAVQPHAQCGFFLLADGENDASAVPVAAAVATPDAKAFFVPFSFPEGRAAVIDLAARPDICKVTASAKRDYAVLAILRADGREPLQNYFDVSLAHYLLQPDMRHELHTLSDVYLHHPLRLLDDLLGKGARRLSLAQADLKALAPWACEQALVSLRLRQPLEEELHKEGMTSLMNDLELPLAAVLAKMEVVGVRIDHQALSEAATTLQAKISQLEEDIFGMAGERFNVGSPSKVGEILFDKLKLSEKAKKTKSGQYSTSEDILEKFADKHPIVGKILEYRQLKKLLTTYLTALPAAVNPVTGRVHTNYNQTVTATGRISSSNPNLQNIPVRDDVGREIRKAFIADPGHLFLSADYSQIELRLVADFAQEDTMLDAFRHEHDIHAITAAKIYHKPLDEVNANERRHAKTANFGILYGITPFGLASRLNIPKAEAKELIDNYYRTFPKLHKYISDSVEEAREHQYTITRMGRKRRLPDINSKNPVVRGIAERNAVNAPIQGTAADIIKTAMVAIDREMRDRGLKSKMIMQVHDELNFDVLQEELPVMQELVVRQMRDAYHGAVTLTASCGVAPNWLDAH